MKEDITKINNEAWDRKVEEGSPWSIPVNPEEIERARKGDFETILTTKKPVPRSWFPEEMKGKKILCLACGGGQQGPILSAAGGEVTVLDFSKGQLAQDRFVAQREGLFIDLVEGDMRDLSAFGDDSFDMVFCPVSVTYIPEVRRVFREVYRVLKKRGTFLFGTINPMVYLFDGKKWEEGIFTVVNKLPFNSMDELDEEEKRGFLEEKNPIEYSHTLEELIEGQTDAGFSIKGFYEDYSGGELDRYTPSYFATRAVK